MSDRDYCYPPDHIVLRNNRLGSRDAPELEAAERRFLFHRLLEPVPAGDFDLAHLKATQRHLFEYFNIAVGRDRHGEDCQVRLPIKPRRFMAYGMAAIHLRILAAGHFQGWGPERFVTGVRPALGDVNHVHPFREDKQSTHAPGAVLAPPLMGWSPESRCRRQRSTRASASSSRLPCPPVDTESGCRTAKTPGSPRAPVARPVFGANPNGRPP